MSVKPSLFQARYDKPEVPAWVYCRNFQNMPPEVIPQIVVLEPFRNQYGTMVVGASWTMIGGQPTWFAGNSKIIAPVVSWLYFPPDYAILTTAQIAELRAAGVRSLVPPVDFSFLANQDTQGA